MSCVVVHQVECECEWAAGAGKPRAALWAATTPAGSVDASFVRHRRACRMMPTATGPASAVQSRWFTAAIKCVLPPTCAIAAKEESWASSSKCGDRSGRGVPQPIEGLAHSVASFGYSVGVCKRRASGRWGASRSARPHRQRLLALTRPCAASPSLAL